MNKVTVGVGTKEEREIEISNHFVVKTKEGRCVSVFELCNKEGFIMEVRNTAESDRDLIQQMWLSIESYEVMFFALSGLNLALNQGTDFLNRIALDETITFNSSKLVQEKLLKHG